VQLIFVISGNRSKPNRTEAQRQIRSADGEETTGIGNFSVDLLCD